MEVREIVSGELSINPDKLTIIAGPCAIESKDVLFKTANRLKEICESENINYLFKSSFDKANRSSLDSFRGIGIDKGLELLREVKEEFGLPIVTDIHLPTQASIVKDVVDVIQIPAFLCRQTDLLCEAAKTKRIINIKKGQFLAPNQMEPIVNKVVESGNNKILLTERGTTFGYNNLVSDFRSIPIMQELGYPVIFDATHSVQLPGALGVVSSGERRFVSTLAKAAIASGVNGLFFEVHPDPDRALCDGPNMIDFEIAEKLFHKLNEIFKLVREK